MARPGARIGTGEAIGEVGESAARDWVDEEAGAGAAFAQVSRLARRAAHRPVLVIALALLAEALVVAWVQRKPHLYHSRVVLLVAEGGAAVSGQTELNGQIRSYVDTVVFSNHNLLALMERLHLAVSRRTLDPEKAVESFREDYEVEVWRNEFLEGRLDEPRSAHLAIEVQDTDPAEAVVLARALADLVMEVTRSTRLKENEEQKAAVGHELAVVTVELARLERNAARLKLELSRAPSRDKQVELDETEQSIKSAQRSYEQFRGERAALDLALGAEQESLGIHFTVLDQAVAEERETRSGAATAAILLFGFLAALALVGLVVGLVEPRVLDARDLDGAGFTVLAELPAAVVAGAPQAEPPSGTPRYKGI